MIRKNLLSCIFVSVCLVAGFALLAPAPLHAQNTANPPSGHWEYDPAGIATPAFVYDPPPAGFNPLTATDAQIAQYGLPPRPSSSDTLRYALWQKMVTAKAVTPQLTWTTRYMGPPQNQQITQAGAYNSDNWSGYFAYSPTDAFSTNNSEILGQWTIPAVQQPACLDTEEEAAQWIGFDGWNSSDVLQAGTSSVVGNAFSCTATTFYAWYEWYPNSLTELSLAVAPGDTIDADVWYTTTSPYGHAELFNLVTSTFTTVGFNPPSGTTYYGNNAEWILERPTVSGTLVNLPNYGEFFLTGAEAFDGTYYSFPAYSENPGTSIYDVNMTCPPWNPSSSCSSTTTISYPEPVQGTYTIVISPEGPAF